MSLLTVFVPAEGSQLCAGIIPGSGIVGPDITDDDDPNTLFRIDYEGARFGQQMTYEDMVMHAAGRHVFNDGKGYPTMAKLFLPLSELHPVALYDTDEWRITAILDQQALDAWRLQHPRYRAQATGEEAKPRP